MPIRKLTLEIDIDDGTVNSIEDLEREILAQDICGQAARKYLDSLQDDLAQQVEIRKGVYIAPYQVEVLTTDGRKLPYEINAARITYMGKPVDIVAFRNITERKAAEEKLREYRDHLEELVERRTTEFRNVNEELQREINERKAAEGVLKTYQYMVESAHDAIFFKDLESRYVIANSKALVAFGLSREDVIGKNDYEIMLNKEEANKNIEDDQLVFRTGKTAELVKQMHGAGGKHFWFQAIKVPQFDARGNVMGLVGIARDITERKAAEKRIEEEYRRAEFYVDLMGHDINNINQVTRGYLEFLLRDSDFPDKFRKYVEIAFDHVRKSVDIISNVETLSKIQSGEIGLERIDIYPAYRSAVEAVKPQSRDVRINSNITEGRYFISGNALLSSVFSNLLNNAVKFDRHDIVKIDVDISSPDDDWRLEFKDRGRGISDDYKNIIFNRLERAGESAQGTGLGLTIVKYIVESYGGSVWVEDRVKGYRAQGSNFIVLLPKGG